MMELQVHLKKLHSGQAKVLSDASRFNILKIGRRWGKTTLAVHELIPQLAIDGKPVAYFAPTYGDLHDVWHELKFILMPIISEKNEQQKQMRLITGGVIDFWSMDNPDSGRGRKYARVVVDEAEKASKFKEAWQNTILPTLIDYGGDAWILSTPKFGDTYFKRLFANGKEQDDWSSFNLSTYQNPTIRPEEIEIVKRSMDELSFRCEILAEDVDITRNAFAYAFDESKHIRECKCNPSHFVTLSFDFNVDPITCTASQHYDNTKFFIKEFRLENSDIYELCQRIRASFPQSTFMVTGDATGRNRQAISRGNLNYYAVIKYELKLGDGQFKQGNVNPSVADTRVLMNSMLQNYNIYIDPNECPYLIRDLKYVEVDDKGDIKKDRSSETRKADLLDCMRYDLYTFHRDYIKQIGL
jgi:hypothetical protein